MYVDLYDSSKFGITEPTAMVTGEWEIFCHRKYAPSGPNIQFIVYLLLNPVISILPSISKCKWDFQ